MFTEKNTKFKNLKDTKNVAPQTEKERKPLPTVDNDAPSSTASTLQLTGTEAESYLKDIGFTLGSCRTITVTKTTSIIGCFFSPLFFRAVFFPMSFNLMKKNQNDPVRGQKLINF